MKRIFTLVLAFASTFILQTGLLFAEEGHSHDGVAVSNTSAETVKTGKYVCPMHADVQSDEPGECPKCGMFLKEVASGEVSPEHSHAGHDHEHA